MKKAFQRRDAEISAEKACGDEWGRKGKWRE
jgi:hypothetical protein